MKKALMLLVATLFLLVIVGNVFGEELAKEGNVSGTTAYSTPVTMMLMGNDAQLTFDALGVFVTDSADSPFSNASIRILGSGLALKGVYNEMGSMCLTLTNGDKIFSTYEGTGIGKGKMKGAFTYTGGTGNFTGITGGGEFERISVANPAIKGTGQGYSISKGTWKLP